MVGFAPPDELPDCWEPSVLTVFEVPTSSLGSLGNSVAAVMYNLEQRLFPVRNLSRLLGESEVEPLDETGVASEQADHTGFALQRSYPDNLGNNG